MSQVHLIKPPPAASDNHGVGDNFPALIAIRKLSPTPFRIPIPDQWIKTLSAPPSMPSPTMVRNTTLNKVVSQKETGRWLRLTLRAPV